MRNRFINFWPLILGALILWFVNSLNTYNHAINDFVDARLASRSVLVDLLNAETGQRGFLITGDERYLEPYNLAIQSINKDQDWLTTRLDNKMPDEINRLKELSKLKIDELALTIKTRREKGFEAAASIAKTDKGREYMVEIQSIVKNIRQNLVDDMEAKQSSFAKTFIRLRVGTFFIILIFAFMTFKPLLLKLKKKLKKIPSYIL